MNECRMKSTVLPDAREGSPTAPRGAPEAWWAGAAPRPFGGSQSGGGLRPREADRDLGKNSFAVPPLKFPLGRGREVRRCPVPRLPRLACPIQRTAAGASAHSPRAARAAPRTAPTPAPTPSPARTTAHGAAAHRPALTMPPIHGSRLTPPNAARACSRRRVGGRRSCHQRLRSRECRAAEMRVAGRCGRRRRGRGVCES